LSLRVIVLKPSWRSLIKDLKVYLWVLMLSPGTSVSVSVVVESVMVSMQCVCVCASLRSRSLQGQFVLPSH
jgi:hypothetical protein